MNFFGVVSFVHDVEIRMFGTMTLSEAFLGMMDIMNRMPGDFQAGDDL
ncbi:MAG: hypothetical protein A4E35_00167 [Methanoregula sp. PtaU1.Bin051]|nr:MAG: hypothetical protein A4E35_00167 [Methanoregula sp. PtaU1.Bin051]